VEADIPIAQGGMRVGICLSSSALAVANAGGIEVIATAGCRHKTFKVQFKG
jgi:NAD(P)H-dependent flavin oxidoreductase YrpB (nitropropane dioxygenase family)